MDGASETASRERGDVTRHRWDVAAYHRMGEVGILNEDDRVELIDGELIECMRSAARTSGQ